MTRSEELGRRVAESMRRRGEHGRLGRRRLAALRRTSARQREEARSFHRRIRDAVIVALVETGSVRATARRIGYSAAHMRNIIRELNLEYLLEGIR